MDRKTRADLHILYPPSDGKRRFKSNVIREVFRIIALLSTLAVLGYFIFGIFNAADERLITEIEQLQSKNYSLRNKVASLESEISDLGEMLTAAKRENANKEKQLNALRKTKAQLEPEVLALLSTQASLIGFLTFVMDQENINILNSTVEWEQIRDEIINTPAGKRKNAILNAILLAWKDIPFVMNQESISDGFDSPRFLRYVLSTVGLDIAQIEGQRLSDTLMNAFEKVDDPMPGDLVFYQGQVGSFGFMLAYVGDENTPAVGIGTLQKGEPLQVISLDRINTPAFPLRGYYRVKYIDE
jgi:outer membrane murein-binding lipoprotein Lpp